MLNVLKSAGKVAVGHSVLRLAPERCCHPTAMSKPQDVLTDEIPPSPIKVTDSPMTQRRKRHKANLLKRLRVVENPYPAADVVSRDTTVTRVVAKFKFDARNERELSFEPGDVIVVLVQDDAEKGWWMGSLKGKEGLLPVNDVDVRECACSRLSDANSHRCMKSW